MYCIHKFKVFNLINEEHLQRFLKQYNTLEQLLQKLLKTFETCFKT